MVVLVALRRILPTLRARKEQSQYFSKEVFTGFFVFVLLPDDETGIISLRFGAEELPLITAVLKRLLMLVVIFLLKLYKPIIFI